MLSSQSERFFKRINSNGKDNGLLFQNEHPIVLELGCGKGEYTVYLAKKHPDKNFIGIDIKGARFWRGAKTVAEKNPNVAFIRAQIEMIANLFAAGEVAEIWITFPILKSNSNGANTALPIPICWHYIIKFWFPKALSI